MDLLRALLFWLDADAWRQGIVAWLALGMAGALALRPAWAGARRRFLSPAWFVLAVIAALAAFRWPTWFYRLPLNPDEAQIVAGAITLDRFPVPWKHLDPTTHGPLCEYGLLAASWLGAPFNYVTARVLAALLQAGALLGAWATLRRLVGETASRLAILPGLFFWCLTSWDDFLHYSSELPGIFFMSWGTYFLTRMLTAAPGDRFRSVGAALAGFSLGLVPYAKLQSVPQAGFLGLAGVVLVSCLPEARRVRVRLIATLLGGALGPTLLHGVFLTLFGQWRQFWYTYLVSAVDFMATSAHRFVDMPGRFLKFSATSASFGWFLWGGLGFCLLYLRLGPLPRAGRAARIVGWLGLGAAWFTVLRPGRESAHYLHLLVVPLATLAGLILGLALGRDPAPANRPSRSLWTVLAAFAALTLAPQVASHAVTYHRFLGHAREHWSAPPSEAARYLLARVPRDGTVAMWGWEPHLLVELQLPHGTREAQSGNQLMQWPLTRFFVERYVHDLERWEPAWFVDAVGPGAFIFSDRRLHAHESVPALARLIAERYEFQAEIGSMRLYRRKSPRDAAVETAD